MDEKETKTNLIAEILKSKLSLTVVITTFCYDVERVKESCLLLSLKRKMDIYGDLKAKGWHLSKEGLNVCTEGLERVTVPAVIQKALNLDLREIGSNFFPDDIKSAKLESISGSGVVQIQKIKNATAPKYEYGSGAPPILRLILTDGNIFVNCLQWGTWKSVNMETPPGTKIYLKPGKIQVQNSFLLLRENQFTLLGGYVTQLVEKWELSNQLASHVRTKDNLDGTGPPPWIPFGKPILTGKTKTGNFRSLDQDSKEAKENEVFKQQRLANIAEVSKAKEGKPKVFGGGKEVNKFSNSKMDSDINVHNSNNFAEKPQNFNKFQKNYNDPDAKHFSSQPSDEQGYRNNSYGNKMDYRGNRNNDYGHQEDSQYHRNDDRKDHEHRDSSHWNRNNDSGGYRNNDRGGYRTERGGHRNDDRGGHRSNDKGGYRNDDRGGYRNNDHGGHRNVDQGGFRNNDQGGHVNRGGYRNDDRGGLRNNDRGGYRNDRGGYRNNERGGYRNNRNFEDTESQSFPRETASQLFEYFPKDTKVDQSNKYPSNNANSCGRTQARSNDYSYNSNSDSANGSGKFNKSNSNKPSGDSHHRNDRRSVDMEDLTQRTSEIKLHGYDTQKGCEVFVAAKPFIKPGVDVMAKYWEDGKTYRAVIHAVGHEGKTCVVRFLDYGNYEEVLVDDVQQVPINSLNLDWNAGPISFQPSHWEGGNKYQDFPAISEFHHNSHRPQNQNRQRGPRQDHKPSAKLYQPPQQRHTP